MRKISSQNVCTVKIVIHPKKITMSQSKLYKDIKTGLNRTWWKEWTLEEFEKKLYYSGKGGLKDYKQVKVKRTYEIIQTREKDNRVIEYKFTLEKFQEEI